jgi:hypothetical protein
MFGSENLPHERKRSSPFGSVFPVEARLCVLLSVSAFRNTPSILDKSFVILREKEDLQVH